MITLVKKMLAKVGIGDPLNKSISTQKIAGYIPLAGRLYKDKYGRVGRLLSCVKGVAKIKFVLDNSIDYIDFSSLEWIDGRREGNNKKYTEGQEYFHIKVGSVLVNKKFLKRKDAIDWGLMNYRGESGWRIISKVHTSLK